MNEEKKEQLSENNEEGVSVREIFRIIGKKIWYVLAGTLAVTVAAVLIFMFVFNPAKKSQSMSFKIDYPFSAEHKYPDGSLFDYRDIVSKDVVKAAKENSDYKEEFASLDVNKILQNEGITISARQTTEDLEAPYVYTVSLKSAYFNGVNAAHFIDALTTAFITEVVASKAANLDYKLDEAVFNEASYKDQLSFLTEQKSIILNQYGSWIGAYKEGYQVLGKSLGTHRTEVKTKLADKDKDTIEDDLTMKGYEYFNDEVDETEIKERIKQLQVELEFDKAILKELSNYYSGYPELDSVTTLDDTQISDPSGNTTIVVGGNSELMSYIKRAQTIQQQIAYLTGKCPTLKNTPVDVMTEEEIDKADFSKMVVEIKAFSEKSLKPQFEELKKSAIRLTEVTHAIYLQDTLISFNSTGVESEGGTSLLIVGVAVCVVAFLVFAVVAYFMGRKGSKTKKSAPAAEEPIESADNSEKTE